MSETEKNTNANTETSDAPPAQSSVSDQPDGPKYRILIGKPGLDGHDRGAKYVARVLRDAGFEVIYTGIRRTPEHIVHAAIQEDVDAIGLSLLSGAHNVLFARVIELLRQQGAGEIVVFGGGTIPAEDIEHLRTLGVADVFTPGTPAQDIVCRIRGCLHDAVATKPNHHSQKNQSRQIATQQTVSPS